jgi:hypothetical protein
VLYGACPLAMVYKHRARDVRNFQAGERMGTAMSDDGNLQAIIFPYDENDCFFRNQHIEIHRIGNYLEIRQGNHICGSIRLTKQEPFDPEAKFIYEPMVIIMIRNGAKWPEGEPR